MWIYNLEAIVANNADGVVDGVEVTVQTATDILAATKREPGILSIPFAKVLDAFLVAQVFA